MMVRQEIEEGKEVEEVKEAEEGKDIAAGRLGRSVLRPYIGGVGRGWCTTECY